MGGVIKPSALRDPYSAMQSIAVFAWTYPSGQARRSGRRGPLYPGRRDRWGLCERRLHEEGVVKPAGRHHQSIAT